MAQNFQAVKYVLIDQPGMTGNEVLTGVKRQLLAGIPLEFGFEVFSAVQVGRQRRAGGLSHPRVMRTLGGHAVVAVGYDDSVQCPNATPGGHSLPQFLGHCLGYGRLLLAAL